MILECEFHFSSLAQPQHNEPADSINRQFPPDEPSELLLIADTLTLTFSGPDRHLAGLDAYTNEQLWKVSQITEVPNVMERGLLLVEPTHFEVDRLSLCATPQFEIAQNKQWVRVVLSENETAFHYEVASNLVVGLKDGLLTDIYLLELMFL